MAWFGDGLSSLSSLKGQITSFTKEVLSEGIVQEPDEQTRELNEANERCVQLQEILNSKDAELSLLRRQNCELQKAVVELNARPRESNEGSSLDDEGGGGGFFWDPPPVKNRDVGKNQEKGSFLQEQLSQATVRIRELEDELKYLRGNSSERKDEVSDGHPKAELLRAKQDMVNRIIQIGEKGRDAERILKKIPLDECALINDFRAAVAKLNSKEQSYMIKSALKALDADNESSKIDETIEKFDVNEKREKFDRPRLESISLISHPDETDVRNGITENGNSETNNYGEIESLQQRIQELQQEKEFLTNSLDELDKEHAQSLDTILVMKDQLQKKHESLQNAYEQLYVECNEAQTKLQLLENKSSSISGKEANNNSLSENKELTGAIGIANEDKQVQTMKEIYEDRDVQTMESSMETSMVQTTKIESDDKDSQTESPSETKDLSLADLTLRVNEILKNCHLEIREDETMFESLAKSYVETNWKKEMLERKLTDATRELKESLEMRDSLQMDCYDMQTNIESLLMQVEHLKSNLPSIPEASEERVASLETETESMSEEINRLHAEHEALKAKHYELITSVSILEGSLRNQENLEAELRNTKEQLDIAKRELDGASKNFENNENIMEDLGRRVHSALEENNELRKKIDSLESSEKRAQEEATKKIQDYEERNMILENELRDVTKELDESREKCNKLENDVVVVTEIKNELERDIEAISLEKEHLETELIVLRENSSEKETSDLIKNLRDQLDSANREKNDLEYDLTNMRKELDATMDRCAEMESRVETLNFEKEQLVKEKNDSMEQLSSSERESSERIELLQTEMNLLSQEYSSLKNELSSEKIEISLVREKLEDSEKKRVTLEQELSINISKLADLHACNEDLKDRVAKLTVLEEELKSLKASKETYEGIEEKYKLQEIELSRLRNVEEESKRMKNESKIFEERCEEAKIVEKKFLETEKRCCELEKLLSDIKTENVDLQDSNDDDGKIIAELTEKIVKLEFLQESANENSAMAKETIENLSRLIREKDQEIESLKSAMVSDLANKQDDDENALASLKAEREEFIRLVQEKHNTNLQYYAEIQRLAQLLNEQATNLQTVIAERDEKATKLTEKEAEILWSQNELKVVRQRLKSLEESQNYGETCGIVDHSRQIAQATILNEKCKALEAALIQEQSSNRIMQNQLTESQLRESNAAKELERLRTHLVEMESSYTEEALVAEENRKQLEAKLLQAEEKAQNSSTVYTSASIRANQQVETLQQQVALISQQRDEIQAKLFAAEDKVLSHTASLTNLQIVLEQFQRDKENVIRAATDKLRQQLNMSYKEQEDLRNEIVNLKTQLSEAKECLQAASRLSEQLDKKSERIRELDQEVTKLTELVNTADQRIQEATSNEEGKVDKNLVKNLLLGFLTASTMDKSSVLRVFATVLEFDESEKEKIGLNHPAANNGWFSGLLGSGGSQPTKDQEASLSAAFVRFLESESKPKPQLPALPISNSSLSRPGHSRQHSSSSTQSGLLLSSITLPSFPDFVPSRNTGSILKEVLKDS